MKLNGTTAAAREAKLCLIGLYNVRKKDKKIKGSKDKKDKSKKKKKLTKMTCKKVKEAKNPCTFDVQSSAVLLTAINLAECLDPHSQRMANIYTIWGTVLSTVRKDWEKKKT